MVNARYILPLLFLMLVFVNSTVAYGQYNSCQIGYLAFKYPKKVNAGQRVTILTGVDVFSCTMGGSAGSQDFRVNMYDAQHALLSSNSTMVSSTASNGIVANVTNVISAPRVAGDYAVYAMAYAINTQQSVVANYDTFFSLTVTLNETAAAATTPPTG